MWSRDVLDGRAQPCTIDGGEAGSGLSTPALVLEAVSCRLRGRLALDGVSFAVPDGSVVGLLGANGAGKTTVIDATCGLLVPTAGRITVLGHEVRRRNLRDIRALIGVVPQETALHDELSARENLRFAAALHGVEAPRARVDEMLALVGLARRAGERCDRLSGGMRRRLVIARALLHAPRLLVLDEPTLGVDAETRHDIWQHLKDLRSGGTSVLLATNDLEEAAALCDRVVVLRDGRVIAGPATGILPSFDAAS